MMAGDALRDRELFGPEWLPRLREAVADLSWLLSRGYAAPPALTLVGDRYQLEARQRSAVWRCAATDEAVKGRAERHVSAKEVVGQTLHIDALNVITTVEVALTGRLLLLGRDGVLRDLASLATTSRRLAATEAAVRSILETMAELRASGSQWLLDRAVPFSGRLAGIVRRAAASAGHAAEVAVVIDPDPMLAACDGIVCSADGEVIDACRQWFHLAGEVVKRRAPSSFVADLRPPGPS